MTLHPLLPRVLLVEDDPSVRRFVTMALEDVKIELVQRESVADAFEYLASHPVDLTLTDLTLTDGSAMRLVEWITHSDTCRVAVFSAGVTATVQQQLEKCKVWRILRKPVSLFQLRDCVTEGVLPRQRNVGAPSNDAPVGEEPDVESLNPADLYFHGDAVLFAAYAASCREQFSSDILSGDRALNAGDLPELRRLAHSLKTVFTLLGQEHDAKTARMLDKSAAAGAHWEAAALWNQVREALAKAALPAAAR